MDQNKAVARRAVRVWGQNWWLLCMLAVACFSCGRTAVQRLTPEATTSNHLQTIQTLGVGGGTSAQRSNSFAHPTESCSVSMASPTTARGGNAVGAQAEWAAPAGLDPVLEETTRLLMELGVPDPRGLTLARAQVAVTSLREPVTEREVYGWVWPRENNQFQLISLRGDVIRGAGVPTAVLPREALAPRATDEGDPVRDGVVRVLSDRAKRLDGRQYTGYVTAALLARAGDAEHANNLWNETIPRAGLSRTQSALLDWAELYYDAGVAAHAAGHDDIARFHLARLDCAKPYLDSQFPAISQDFAQNPVGFLMFASELLRDHNSRGRLTAASPPTDPATLAQQTPTALLGMLNTLFIPQGDSGQVMLGDSPLYRALLHAGTAQVPLIIDQLERDQRYTRCVGFEAERMVRVPIAVRVVLARLLSDLGAIFRDDFAWNSLVERAVDFPSETAVILRERWASVAHLTALQRAELDLQTGTGPERRALISVARLLPATGESTGQLLAENTEWPVIMDPTRPSSIAIDATTRQRLARLIQQRISPLPQQPLARAEHNALATTRCGWSEVMYVIDPRGSLPLLRETFEYLNANEAQSPTPHCSAELALALALQGDRPAMLTLVNRFRTMNVPTETLRNTAWWFSEFANVATVTPFYTYLAEQLAQLNRVQIEAPGMAPAPGVTFTSIRPISEHALRVAAIRAVVDRHLQNTQRMLFVRRGADPTMYELFGSRGRTVEPRTEPATGPLFIQQNALVQLRVGDMMAAHIADECDDAPRFDYLWTEAQRDQTIASTRRWLQGFATDPRHAGTHTAGTP